MKLNTYFVNVVKNDNDVIMFYDTINDCVWEMDLQMRNLNLVRKLKDDYKMLKYNAFRSFLYNNCIYISTRASAAILIFDIQKQKFTHYESKEIHAGKSAFEVLMMGDKLLMLPQKISEPTYVFDMEKRTFSKKIWIKEQDIIQEGRGIFLHKNGNDVWFPIENTNYVYRLDGISFEYEKIELPADMCIGTLCIHNGEQWYSSNDQCVIYRRIGDSYECVRLDETDVKNAFSVMISKKDNIIVMPREAGNIYIYNSAKETVNKIAVPIDVRYPQRRGIALMLDCYEEKEQIYFWPWGIPEIYVLDIANFKMEELELSLPLQEYLQIFDEYTEVNIGISEYSMWVCKRRERESAENAECMIGKNIYNICKMGI